MYRCPFHSSTYTTGFTNSSLVIGAFPLLHAGNVTLEALFLSHFFPQTTRYIWAYAGILYWGQHVSYPPLPHRCRQWNMPRHRYTFPTNSRGLQPSRHPWPQLFDFRTNEEKVRPVRLGRPTFDTQRIRQPRWSPCSLRVNSMLSVRPCMTDRLRQPPPGRRDSPCGVYR